MLMFCIWGFVVVPPFASALPASDIKKMEDQYKGNGSNKLDNFHESRHALEDSLNYA
jgi:hypothetical protein